MKHKDNYKDDKSKIHYTLLLLWVVQFVGQLCNKVIVNSHVFNEVSPAEVDDQVKKIKTKLDQFSKQYRKQYRKVPAELQH